jgi:3-isopropylmalate/(R)-2-methylmalate dehydratase small subunit
MSGVPDSGAGLPNGGVSFVEDGVDKSRFRIIVAGKNFGCGSSREHAPLALAEAGVEAVVAVSYARIFYRNSVNGGYLIPCESSEDLSSIVATGDEVELDLDQNTLRVVAGDKTYALKSLGEILPILEAGNIFEYARTSGMIDR